MPARKRTQEQKRARRRQQEQMMTHREANEAEWSSDPLADRFWGHMPDQHTCCSEAICCICGRADEHDCS